jgi:hypothetical protein
MGDRSSSRPSMGGNYLLQASDKTQSEPQSAHIGCPVLPNVAESAYLSRFL